MTSDESDEEFDSSDEFDDDDDVELSADDTDRSLVQDLEGTSPWP